MNFVFLGAAAVAGFLYYVSKKPDTFQVTRQLTMPAEAEKVFPLIADFHKWNLWSPWERRDPTMKKTYSGSESGKGAIYEWQGNDKVGSGRMEILEATPSSKIVIKLDFIKPFEGHNTAEFTLTPSDNQTNVCWTMTGPSNFISKIFHTFMDMDKMIGGDFESGLQSMSTAAASKN